MDEKPQMAETLDQLYEPAKRLSNLLADFNGGIPATVAVCRDGLVVHTHIELKRIPGLFEGYDVFFEPLDAQPAIDGNT